MKRIAPALLLLATPAVAADRSFDMFGLNTDSSYAGEIEIAGKRCKLKGSGREECLRYAGGAIGTVPIIGLTSSFNNGKFIVIRGTTITNYFINLDESFTEKYGPSTKTENVPWQNKMGATFENIVKTWTFTDGMLELRARGNQRDTAEFLFIANKNLPERQAPPVNF